MRPKHLSLNNGLSCALHVMRLLLASITMCRFVRIA
jgi:hypothetical protein